jgi:hypothetical protein
MEVFHTNEALQRGADRGQVARGREAPGERTDGPARRQPPRARLLLAAPRQPPRPSQLGAVRLPRPSRARLLRRPGTGRDRRRRRSALRSRPRSYDRDLSDLIGELSTRSDTFRTRWAAHNVRYHDTGSKRFHHPLVGELNLTYETMQLVADTGLMLFVYTAEPGSKSEEAMNLLASWAATPEEAEAPNRTDR